MMPTDSDLTFQEFSVYLGSLQKRGMDPSKIPGLPITEQDFVHWWQRVTVSADLCNRWTRRIRQGEQLMAEIADDTGAVSRAA